MKNVVYIAILLFFRFPMFGQQTADTLPLLRTVAENTLQSPDLPKATFEFGPDFKYLGGDRFTLYGVADAELHLFVRTTKSGAVNAFYWVQFEHYLPSNTHTYNYESTRVTKISGLPFVYDTVAFKDYSVVNRNPASDGGHAVALLAKKGLAFPRHAVRLRMFYLPNVDRRSELMIIYGEALPEGSKFAASEDGTKLDDASPAEVQRILDRARSQLKIQSSQ